MQFSSGEIIRYLHKAGYRFEGGEGSSVIKGLCPNPAHNDRNIGSFVIWLDGGACKCYSCGWTGDFIKFIQEYRGLTFKEAMEFLDKDNSSFFDSLNFKKKEEIPVYQSDIPESSTGLFTFPSPGRDFKVEDFQYLVQRGYTEEYKKHFGMYYCDRSAYKTKNPKTGEEEERWLYDYVILPIGKGFWEARDVKRDKENKPKTQYPKYHKVNCTIFNEENLRRDEPLYITEGAGSHPKLWTNISRNSSFIFGANLSKEQKHILSGFREIVWIPDPDDAGLKLIFSVAKSDLAEKSWVLDVPLDDTDEDYVRCILKAEKLRPVKYILRKTGIVYG